MPDFQMIDNKKGFSDNKSYVEGLEFKTQIRRFISSLRKNLQIIHNS